MIKDAKTIANNLVITGMNLKKIPSPNSRNGVWAEAIENALLSYGRQVAEECARIAEDTHFKGDYKDCPAAWLKSASELLAKRIRQRLAQ